MRAIPQVKFAPNPRQSSYGAEVFAGVCQRVLSRFSTASENFAIPAYTEDVLVKR
jgi:hypothetical protein